MKEQIPYISVWTGYYGEYTIPEEIAKQVRFTKGHWPDKRNKKGYKVLMGWVKAIDTPDKMK